MITDMKRPSTPLSVIMQDARQKTFKAFGQVQEETGLPAFLFEGILLDILAQVREQKNSEILQDLERMREAQEQEPDTPQEGGSE